MLSTEEKDARWERAWSGASEFERRRYRALGWRARLGTLTLMLVAGGWSLGDAFREATRYTGELDGTQPPR